MVTRTLQSLTERSDLFLLPAWGKTGAVGSRPFVLLKKWTLCMFMKMNSDDGYIW